MPSLFLPAHLKLDRNPASSACSGKNIGRRPRAEREIHGVQEQRFPGAGLARHNGHSRRKLGHDPRKEREPLYFNPPDHGRDYSAYIFYPQDYSLIIPGDFLSRLATIQELYEFEYLYFRNRSRAYEVGFDNVLHANSRAGGLILCITPKPA
jgi:hypothetical protein